MTTASASQSIKCAYVRSRYELKFFGKAHTVECPRLRQSNSVKSLKARSCVISPTGNICENAACEKIFEKMDTLQGLNIILVSANVDLWSKTGGLSNVLDGLPLAMAASGHRVMVITPLYNNNDAWDTGYRAEIDVRDKYETVNFFHRYERGVNWVFVDNPMFLQKVWGMTSGQIYDSVTSTDNHETQICLSLLCLAALEAPRILKFSNDHFSGPYGEDVVFVCNDWHTALLPCYLKSLYQPHGIYTNAKVAFCIHDIISQGRFAFDDFALLNLPDSFRPSFEFNDGYDKSVKGNKMNWMKAGVEECDLLLTVSPYYAEELRSVDECAFQLGQFIKSKKPTIMGIVSGMDVSKWNPTTDEFINTKYDASNVHEKKPLNKEALQIATGLPVDRDIPLIVFIGCLQEKDGLDILASALTHLMQENIQFLILGTGKKRLELQLEGVETKYPEKMRILTSFTPFWLHQVIASADLLVVPSRIQPCGFFHLLGMKFGTLPVVSCTGGHVDTVIDGKTGFYMSRFSIKYEEVDPCDVLRMVASLKHAIKVIGTDLHKKMIQNCMAQDLSWKGPAKEWERALLSLGVKGNEIGVDAEETAPLLKENEANL